jgi:hypothetical protein
LLLSACSHRKRQQHHAITVRFIAFDVLPKLSSGKRHDRANFHATKSRTWNLPRHRRRSRLVGRFNEIEAAELLFGFRERAVSG